MKERGNERKLACCKESKDIEFGAVPTSELYEKEKAMPTSRYLVVILSIVAVCVVALGSAANDSRTAGNDVTAQLSAFVSHLAVG